jgi:vacuolar-type H+-ATPase subunit H
MKDIVDQILQTEQKMEEMLREQREKAGAMRSEAEKESSEKITRARSEAQQKVQEAVQTAKREAEAEREELLRQAGSQGKNIFLEDSTRIRKLVEEIADTIVEVRLKEAE